MKIMFELFVFAVFFASLLAINHWGGFEIAVLLALALIMSEVKE